MDGKTNKSLLLPSLSPSNLNKNIPPKSPVSKTKAVIYVALLILCQCLFWKYAAFDNLLGGNKGVDLCPQATELVPQKNVKVWRSLGETFRTKDFKTRAVNWLGGAVRVP